MDAAGDVGGMTEKQVLFRLVGDVEGLKRDSENNSRAMDMTRQKVDRIEDTLDEMNRKLDRLVEREESATIRLRDVEQGVADYRRLKLKVFSIISGVGIGAGSIGGAVSTWLGKILSGQS